MYNFVFFEEMRENNTHLMAIPPHTSHILQPLDSTPFVQFKCNWQARLLEWNIKVLAKCHFFKVFWPAWQESMSVGKIQSVFHKTGIFPMNMSAIPKSKYTPAQVTDSKKIEQFWVTRFYVLIDFL